MDKPFYKHLLQATRHILIDVLFASLLYAEFLIFFELETGLIGDVVVSKWISGFLVLVILELFHALQSYLK